MRLSLSLIVFLIPLALVFAQEEEWKTFEIIGKYKNSDPPIPDQTFIAQYRVINGTLESITGDDTKVVAKVNTTDAGWFELKFPRNLPYRNTDAYDDVDLFIGINGYGSDAYYLPETTPMMEHVREKIINKVNRPLPHPTTYSEKTDCYFVFQIPFYTYAEIEIVYGWNGLISDPYHGDKVPEYCVQETTVVQNIIPTPRQQMKMGIPLYEIKCKEGFYPTFKIDRVTPACVTESTLDKLLIRGWSPLRMGMPAETNILITYGAIQAYPHNVTKKLDPRSPYFNDIFWVNNDIVPHTVVTKTGTWNTGVIESGKIGSMSFNKTGIYKYFIKEKPSTIGFVEFSGIVELDE